MSSPAPGPEKLIVELTLPLEINRALNAVVPLFSVVAKKVLDGLFNRSAPAPDTTMFAPVTGPFSARSASAGALYVSEPVTGLFSVTILGTVTPGLGLRTVPPKKLTVPLGPNA